VRWPEDRVFRAADGSVHHGQLKVRFGEVEQRGIALTPTEWPGVEDDHRGFAAQLQVDAGTSWMRAAGPRRTPRPRFTVPPVTAANAPVAVTV
jgi:hypothetical protein